MGIDAQSVLSECLLGSTVEFFVFPQQQQIAHFYTRFLSPGNGVRCSCQWSSQKVYAFPAIHLVLDLDAEGGTLLVKMSLFAVALSAEYLGTLSLTSESEPTLARFGLSPVFP